MERGGGVARARGISHASPPHDLKKQRRGWDWVSRRQEEEHGHHHRRRLRSSRSNSPRNGGVQQVKPVKHQHGENLTREFSKHDEHRIHYSDVRQEFVKEQFPKYPGNNQDSFTQKSIHTACRRDAAVRRSSSIEKEQQYPKYSDVSREFVKEQYPKYSVNNQSDFTQRTITTASRRDEEIRRPSSTEKEQYPKYSNISREFVKEQYSKYSFNNRDNFTQKLITTASGKDDDIRNPSSIETVRCSSAADMDDFRRPLPISNREYSAFRFTDGEDGLLLQGHNSSFAPSLAVAASAANAGSGNKVIGMDTELRNQNKDTQFARSVEGKVLDTCGMLEQRSIVLKDGTVQTFFTLPPPTSSEHPLSKPKIYSTNDVIGSKTGILYSDDNVAFGPPPDLVGTLHRQDSQYTKSKNNHELHCGRLSLGQAVNEQEKNTKEMNFSRSAAYNIGLVQSKSSALDTNSSILSRDALLPGHRDSLHSSSEDVNSGKLHNVSINERHRQRDTYINENDLVVNAQNLSTEALQPHLGRRLHGSPSRGKALASYTENAWRERPESTFVSHDLNINGWHSPYQDSAHSSQRGGPSQYGSSVRSYIDDLRPDWTEDTGVLRSHWRGDKNDHPMESDPADHYGDMCRTSSPRAISSDLHGESFKSKRGYLSDVLRRDASRNNLTRHDRKERSYRREFSAMDHMEKSRTSLQEASAGSCRSKLSPLSRSHLSSREADLHGNVGRVLKRKYSDEDNHRGDIGRVLLKDQDKSRKLREMDFEDNWRGRERTPMHRTYVGRTSNDKSSRRISDSRLHPVSKSFHMSGQLLESKTYQAKINGHSKWKKQDWHCDNHPSQDTKEEQNFHHPYKFQKSSVQYDEQGTTWNEHYAKDDELSCNKEPFQQPDLAEDSDTFKQQVQRAFLRFSKVLNESSWQQKQYEEQGKAGSLLCIVCSSRFPKDFVDTHSLVMHTFNSQKAGLRAEHLGLHKALCVLMGWNHAVPPDDAKVYQSLAVPDARAMKEDLILWPPLVIVHNANGEIKKDGSEHVISNLDMDEILQGLGFSNGKIKVVVNGSSANQGTLLVKFSPIFSGLQEAERLHKYFEDNHCGRNDWLLVQSLHKSQQNISKDSDLLQADGNAKDNKKPFYGYIGIAGDLEKVDFDTRKRSLVKSRKDIEAITDGPVHGA